ncbi:MAG: sulfatase, partial [Chloroflexota bacterium]
MPALLVASLLCLACAAPSPPADAPRPDVVLIVVDALRADRLGAAGYPKPLTPNIDRLAAEGALFTEAYSQATWTKPSIATLMTSLYPTEHGLVRLGQTDPSGRFVTDRLSRSATTLAERFRDAGYQTLAVVNQVHLQKKLGFAQGFDRFEWRRGKSAFELNAIFGDLLDERDERPMFAWLHYLDVHWPYNSRLTGDAALDLGPTEMEHEPPQGLQWVTAWQQEHFDDATRAALEVRYDQEVAFVDAAIGELVERLRA